MAHPRFRAFVTFGLLAVAPALLAGPMSREEVPVPLAPWVDWALKGHEEALCPFLQGRPDSRHCAWPGTLTLDLNASGGRFSQTWRLQAASWILLPGDATRWPQDVKIEGTAAAVLQRGEAPALRLKAGVRTVTGSFKWDALPEALRVPAETGLLALAVNGASVAQPIRDEWGRVWLQKARAVEGEESRVDVAVHRRVIDDLPLALVTQIQLRVSGKNREAILGKALPPGFVPMSLTGPLPARLDPDGRLRVQVRAGTWDLELTARWPDSASAFTLAESGGIWDPEEVWIYEARPDLRIAAVEGPPAIDPQQTELPGEWRSFPAYLMRPGTTLKLVERRRGDADPKPDRLSLDRTFWLDFNGKGLSVQDSMSGTLSRSWRLEMGPETALGRAAVGGRDQFLTSLKPGGPAGVEVREGAVVMTADSRVQERGWTLPAVGWAHDFERVGARLNLPPGWRLLHARGVDAASPTWVGAWTLLDLFLVLIFGLSVGKLWGRRWGGAALAAGVLSWHEPGALRWLWLWAVAAEALVRALPEGGFRKAVWGLQRAAWGLIVLFLVPFFLTQARWALYPQLEPTYDGGRFASMLNGAMGSVTGASMGAAGGAPGSPAEFDAEVVDAGVAQEGEVFDQVAQEGEVFDQVAQSEPPSRSNRLMSKMSSGKYDKRSSQPRDPIPKQYFAIDPKALVNTGPGIPDWNWRSVQLTWRGPVTQDQRLSLWLLSPGVRALLTVARVALLAALALLLFGLPIGEWLEGLRSPEGRSAALKRLLPALLLFFATPAARAADASFPTPELLNDLRERMLRPPECSPNCAESPRLALEATPGSLVLRLEIHAAAATAVPIPGGAKQWMPARALLDGNPAGVRRGNDGSLWLSVGPGAHQVLLEGPLPAQDSVQVALPLKPRRVEAKVSGWTLHGLGEDGEVEQNLQLNRTAGAGGPAATLQQGNFPAFVRVERTLRLGLSWQVETRVERLTPIGAPLVLEIPLLAGESVTQAGLRVKNGKAQLNLAPHAQEASWTSSLDVAKEIALKAPEVASWVELWRLEAGPVWHVEAKGIPPVHHEPAGGARVREWRPWPGEAVQLEVTRPEGVPGQTLTIDRVELAAKPGLRAQDLTLSLRLRSSRGTQHPVTLPEGAELQSVAVDGVVQPLRQEGRRVVLPIQPGSHAFDLAWRQRDGARLFYRLPEVALGASAVNANLSIAMGRDRWILLVGGPRLGPAVLFWTVLLVFLLVSVGLGKTQLAPLRWTEWFLLSIGLTQVSVLASMIVAGWLLALGYRRKSPPEGDREFDVLQVFLAGLTLAALVCLFRAIKRGLLGLPDMQIAGNGSSSELLRWYLDRPGDALPRPWALSVPLMVYRVAMLVWALWLADALLKWLRWGWQAFSTGGLWRPLRKPKDAPSAAGPVP